MLAACFVPILVSAVAIDRTRGRSSQAPSLLPSALYEANLRAFGPKANFAAVEGRLDAIRAIGTDVVWLMPIQPVGKLRSAGGLGSPYAVADYDRVNPEFGTEADFRRLVVAARRRGMRVILDWVPNHTAWDHPWVAAHPEWYTRNAKGEIQIPEGTNWQDVADLDFASRPMRRAMIAAMRGWVTKFGIDGFRCDTADWVPADFWREAISVIRASTKRPILMLAEGARGDHYSAGFDMTYGWEVSYRLREAFAGKSAKPVVAAIRKEEAAAPKGKASLRFTTNHDWSAWDGSALELFHTPRGGRTAFSVAALSGGVPLVYTGQEVAWPDRIPIFTRTTIDWRRDPAQRAWLTKILGFRRTHAAARSGTLLDLSSEDVVAFSRRAGKERILVLANVRAATRGIDLPESVRGAWKDVETGTPVRLGAKIALPADGGRVLIRTEP